VIVLEQMNKRDIKEEEAFQAVVAVEWVIWIEKEIVKKVKGIVKESNIHLLKINM